MEALLSALAQSGNPNLRDLQDLPEIPPQALLEALVTQGSNVVGLPMDMAYLAQAALDSAGVPNPYPLGEMRDVPMTSDWLASKGGVDVDSPEYLMGSVMTPDAASALKLENLIQAMTVFHGSPHKWDKVDLSKVGTGEGAQAYGHGFYAAEAEDVAKEYAVKGQQGIGSITKYHGQELPDTAWADIAPVMIKHDIPGDILPNQTEAGMVRGILDDYADVLTDAEKAKLKPWANPEGHLYELDLPDETIDKMLDWDKPLSEQPEIMAKVEKYWDDHIGDPDIIKQRMGIDDKSTGKDLYNKLQGNMGGAMDARSQKVASDYLNERGIPGIKYLDGTSRSAGEGTRNFVIFDEDTITPLKRNGEDLR